jgi:hypothetical protein
MYRFSADSIGFNAGGNTAFRILNIGAAVNYLGVYPGSIVNPPRFQCLGSEDDIDLELRPKGTGAVFINSNVGIGTTNFGASATQTLAIETGTAPTTGRNNTIQIYSSDLSAGNTMLSIFGEGSSFAAGTPSAATGAIAIRVNGTVYYLTASTTAPT